MFGRRPRGDRYRGADQSGVAEAHRDASPRHVTRALRAVAARRRRRRSCVLRPEYGPSRLRAPVLLKSNVNTVSIVELIRRERDDVAFFFFAPLYKICRFVKKGRLDLGHTALRVLPTIRLRTFCIFVHFVAISKRLESKRRWSRVESNTIVSRSICDTILRVTNSSNFSFSLETKTKTISMVQVGESRLTRNITLGLRDVSKSRVEFLGQSGKGSLYFTNLSGWFHVPSRASNRSGRSSCEHH